MEASLSSRTKKAKVGHGPCTMKKKEQVSHKVIEKRRRDRINSCLAELSQAVPAAFVKQNSGKLEKAEILEMTVEYLRTIHALGQRIENANHTTYTGEWYGLNPLLYAELQRHYSAGYSECAQEVMRFLGDSHSEDHPRYSRILDFLQSRGSLHHIQMLPSTPASIITDPRPSEQDSAAADLRCGFRGTFCRSHHCYCRQQNYHQLQPNKCKDMLPSSPPPQFHQSVHHSAFPPKPPLATIAPPVFFSAQSAPPLVRLIDNQLDPS